MMIYYISDVLKKTSKRRRYFSCTLKEELTFNPYINWAFQERDEEPCSPLPFQPKCALVSEEPPVDDQEQVDSFIQAIAVFALWAPNACQHWARYWEIQQLWGQGGCIDKMMLYRSPSALRYYEELRFKFPFLSFFFF